MNIDTLLTDTFAAHEHLAPDQDAVHAAVQRRVETHRSGFARPLGIAASVAVMLGIAGAAVAVSNTRHPAAGHAAIRHGQPALASVSATVRRPDAHIAPLTMPYDLGWVPDGAVSYGARRVNIGGVSETSPPSFDGEYLFSVRTANQTLDLDVQQMPGTLADAGFKSGPGADIRIDGRPGIESRNSGGPGGYEVYFVDSAGGLMYVNAMVHPGSTASAAELTRIGRALARNVRFPGTAQVEPTFGIGDVPAGMQVLAFDVENGVGALVGAGEMPDTTTMYDIGASNNQQTAVSVGTAVPAPSGTPGRRVQGHPTRYSDDHGYRTVSVLDAVHGTAVALSGRVSEDVLYGIADGLVLPG